LEWLPRRQTGREIHVATILRWVKFGLAGVRLEAVRIGATLCTSEPALRRFFAALTAADPMLTPPAKPKGRARTRSRKAPTVA
jgi:hypothetical protein